MRLVILAFMANAAFAAPLASQAPKLPATVVILNADKQGLTPARTYSLQGVSEHGLKDAIRNRCHEFQNCVPIATIDTGCQWVSIGPFREKFVKERMILPNYGATYGVASTAAAALTQCNLYGNCLTENVSQYCAS